MTKFPFWKWEYRENVLVCQVSPFGIGPYIKDPRPEDMALICHQRELVNFELLS